MFHAVGIEGLWGRTSKKTSLLTSLVQELVGGRGGAGAGRLEKLGAGQISLSLQVDRLDFSHMVVPGNMAAGFPQNKCFRRTLGDIL